MAMFSDVSLAPPLLRALAALGFATMTPIQAEAVPLLLAGRDLFAQAPTGSGKTVAFGLALLGRLDAARMRTQALVLVPTRELAEQVAGELRRLARFIPNTKIVALSGGVPVRTQVPSLTPPPHVIVATPGRLLDHRARGSIDLTEVATLVVDEADRMLGLGFAEAVAEVVAGVARPRQTALFSATLPPAVRALSCAVLRDPAEVTVASVAPPETIRSVFVAVEAGRRFDALVDLLRGNAEASALVFCHTRRDAAEVAARLVSLGFSARALHGELVQRERDEVLTRLAHRSLRVLVATDVAARGLDVGGLELVVSYELPTNPDIHIHRTGRTGRAGQRGLAAHLVAPAERARAAAIAERLGQRLEWGALPAAASGEATRAAGGEAAPVAGGEAASGEAARAASAARAAGGEAAGGEAVRAASGDAARVAWAAGGEAGGGEAARAARVAGGEAARAARAARVAGGEAARAAGGEALRAAARDRAAGAGAELAGAELAGAELTGAELTGAGRAGLGAEPRFQGGPEAHDARRPGGGVPGRAPNVTLVIDGGKADKLRPGDVLGALIGETGLEAESIGKIDVGPKRTLVAVRSDCAGRAVASGRIKIKGRRFRIGALR